ncbi:serine/threonine-protein kinase [Actinokineospora cianjurensis]|uniref:non-specific serine/threonine protein kinase n=1 Tax=Actinokineospora cianjurensis TaxID=585224 RepID=A0A421B6D2_9PSEU|nr:serine/threonine-protein kinase [Actinokineospora cianjurensis]RLK59780.1 serine/threonine protein kinase [Actinokineospora cianjurensis]
MSPPELPGLTLVRFLGSGGFAEVYLYRQAEPKRDVAVKVLKDAALAARFAEEADAMAELGDHPNIAQVFFTGVSADGRSYLVMPYYPRANFAERARTERIPVTEVLRVGVRIAGAVQAAHEVGILHRDIKPANVLVDRLGEPRLADFGIAGRTPPSVDGGVLMSVPWSPPEVLRGGASSFQSDVYSLGATVWHLLAGRSPFEVPDGDNGVDALADRIQQTAATRTGRADVPGELEEVLLRAMAPEPGVRYTSAREFARALRAIEQRGGFPEQTTVLPPQPARVEAAEETRLRPVKPNGLTWVIAPPTYVDPPPPEINRSALDGAPPPWSTPPAVAEIPIVASDTVNRPRTRPWAAITLGGLALAAAVVTGVVLLSEGEAGRPADPGPVDPGVREQNAGGPVAPPGKPTVTAARVDPGILRFTWTYSAQFATDSFAWRTSDLSRSGTAIAPTVDIPAPAGSLVCLEVKVVRADGSSASASFSPPGCGS